MAVFPDRIVLKNSTDDQATIEAAIGAGGTDEIAQGEIVVGVNPTDVKFYTKAGDGSIVSLGGTGTGATTLGELSDVDLSTPATDGQVIAYNTTSGNWEPVSQSGGGGYTDPLTTDGDIVIRSSGVTTRLGIGTSGQVLTVTGGIPSWENATGGGATTTLDLTDVTGVPLVEYSFTQDAGTSSIGSALVNFQDYGAPGSFEKYQIYISQTEQGGGQDFWAWIQANLIPGDSNTTADIYVKLPGMTSAQLATAYLNSIYPNAYVLELPRNVGQNPDQADWLGAYFPLTDGVSEISFVPGNSAGAYGDEGMVMRSNGRVIGGFSVASLDVNDLGDVDTSTNAPTDGQVLAWVDANSQWEPADAGGALPVVPAGGEVLASDGTAWTSQGLPLLLEGGGSDPDIRLDFEGSGDTQILNASGMTSTYPSTDAKFGSGGATFLRSNQDYLQGTWPQALGTQTFTLSFWVKTTDTDYSVVVSRRIVTPVSGTNLADGFQVMRESAGGTTYTPHSDNAQGAIVLSPEGTAASYLCSTRTIDVADGNWHYVVIQHEGGGVYSCFFDGALTERRTATAAVNFATNGGFYLGRRQDGNADAYFTGSIDNYVLEIGSVLSTGSTVPVPTAPRGATGFYGAGASIGNLNDVDTTTAAPTDGQVLTWVDANSQWEPASTSIDDLTDVDTASVAPTNGQVLEWDGTNWVPADVTGGGAIATTPAPSGPTDTGTAGEIKYDADYIYLAVATNTWKRAALSTWVPAGTIVEVINYTGNGGTQSITGAGFQPGLIFIRKPSSSMYVVSESTSTLGHFLWGNGALVTGGITSLDADGFTLGADADINQSGVNYTALCVKTGQSLASNDGTIQFDYHRIAGCNHGVYTGTGNTSSTYGHGLSVAPEMFVNKRFANAQGYISGNTLGPTGKSLYLNATFFYVNAATYSTLNSTVVSAGNSNVNTSGQESWSLFAENVSNQTACGDVFFGGTVAEEVNLGFTPRFVIFREYTPQASTTTSGQTRELFYYNQTLDSTGNASFLNVSTSSDGVSSALSWTANGFELAVGAGGNDGTTRAMYIAFR